jgi:hypothetical protein
VDEDVNVLRRFVEIRCKLSPFPVYVGDVKDEVLHKEAVYGPLPVAGLPVLVQCDGFRCMAFRDKQGRWIDLFTREFVPRVFGVVPA